MEKEDKVDLSADEDLSIALMNLIAIEEHLYFSGMKTGKKRYISLLRSAREIRRRLLKEIVKEPEGEVWCISKHLLAASMRLIEVGTKHLTKEEERKAEEKFQDAFYLYSLFWGLNLELVEAEELRTDSPDGPEPYISPEEGFTGPREKVSEDQSENLETGWRGKITAVVKKVIDCCRE